MEEETIIPLLEMYVVKVLFNKNMLDYKPLCVNFESIGTHVRYPTTSHYLCHHHPGQNHHHLSYCNGLRTGPPAFVLHTHPHPAPSWLSHNSQLILLKQVKSPHSSAQHSAVVPVLPDVKATIFTMVCNIIISYDIPLASSPSILVLATLPATCWTPGTSCHRDFAPRSPHD